MSRRWGVAASRMVWSTLGPWALVPQLWKDYHLFHKTDYKQVLDIFLSPIINVFVCVFLFLFFVFFVGGGGGVVQMVWSLRNAKTPKPGNKIERGSMESHHSFPAT